MEDFVGNRSYRSGGGRGARGGRGRPWRGGRGGARGGGRGGGRGGRGAYGDTETRRPIRLGFKALKDLQSKTPDEIVLDLTSSRCFPASEFLLKEQSPMTDDVIVLIVSILSKACDCSSKEYLIKLLNLLPGSLFLNLNLRQHLNSLSASRRSPSDLAEFLKNVIKVMNELLRRFPNAYADLPIPDLYCGAMVLSEKGNLEDANLMNEVGELMKLKTEKASELKRKDEERRQGRGRVRRNAGENDDLNPPDDFRHLSVIPTQEDILTGERPFLRRNKVDGSYHDAEHYLDVQFRLLREDFVRPLREGIAKLLERIGSAKIGALQDIRVYKDVQLLYPVCTSNGLQYKVKFDNTNLRKVRWENSKRLIFGSLMCLSKDKFGSFVFATVANRDLKDLKQGIVDIQFIKLSDNVRLEEGEVYQMVESTVYFEAYRHILEGLKEVQPHQLPLQRYIVNCQKHVEAPAYLRNRLRGRVTFDLTPIMKKGSNSGSTGSKNSLSEMRARLTRLSVRDEVRRGTDVPLLHLAHWPSADDLELDDSQYRALQMALTKEFAVIQGPPGTGKTYIGLKIANVLLHNKLKWDTGTEFLDDERDVAPLLSERRPFLVVCYTNHALDQFLEGIHKFHSEGIVRIGGRSQSEIMKACSLSELKHRMHKDKKAPLHIRRAYYDAHQEMDHTTTKLQGAAEDLKKCYENVLHEDALHQRVPSMTGAHYDSLRQVFAGRGGHKESAILYWLQLSLNADPGQGALQPVAFLPLNKQSAGLELVSRANLATLNNVTWSSGENSSLQLSGAPNSFVMIPNHPGSDLDTRTSITLLLHVFPTGNRGSILSFHEDGLGLQISQEGVIDGKGILSARFVRRDITHPPALTKAVFNMNSWNFIGASYDHETGIARLWHDGNEVEAKYLGRKQELATQFCIRIGALENAGNARCFRGRVANLRIFAEPLGKESIMTIGGIVAQDGAGAGAEAEAEEVEEEEEENENPDVLYEADVMQGQRVLDIDNIRVYGSKVMPGSGNLKVADPFAFTKGAEGGWQIQNPEKLKKKLKRTMVLELSRKDVMQAATAKAVQNVWSLRPKDRWRLYRRWLTDLAEGYRRTISMFQEKFEEGAKRLKDVRNMEDFEILKNADVVGMTTTGAAKYRKLLQRLRPRITIVEEAAEVLESHIVTSLTPGCQHLILIGDHQQLRPNPTVYELAKDYNLDVSLFERMVKNGMPYERLRLQHRMRPEISKMLEHIYFSPKLENHESVMNFENIKGVARNMYFVDHAESENFLEEGRSRSNEHEAKFLAALCRYFILQGYEREKITVLTAYTGQLIQLKKEMPKDFFRGVRVCAVDNFQGEENDIILLSLVRSNEEGKIGFLQTENRVCVALSRAKKGFFCIGNISLLEAKSQLWKGIIDDMRQRGNVGDALLLTCQNHPQNVIQASRAEDFKKAPEGGCTVPCSARLECGHVCEMVCHPTDPEHKEYQCKKPCAKTICRRDHKCRRRCYQDCGPCMELVMKRLPCGHTQNVPCSKSRSEAQCQSPCSKFLRCGHKCANKCYEECTENCTFITTKKWACGHENGVECHVNPRHSPCKAPCGVTLNCEHPCGGSCSDCLRGRVHQPCKAVCGRTLFCGHNCSEPCTKNCPPCKEKCGNYCKHSNCKKKCGEPCEPCNERCVWQCPHYRCKKLCGELCDRPRCNEPCPRLLRCRHPCIGLCGEPCPKKCRECHKDEVTEIFFGTEDEPDARFVELADCGHMFEVKMMDQWMDQAEVAQNGKPVDVQLKLCPKCRVPIRTSLRYGNIVKKMLADFEKIKQKILLSKQQRELKVSIPRANVQKIHEFPEDRDKISKYLDSKNLTDEQVNVCENQINLLIFLQTLKDNIEKGREAEEGRANRFSARHSFLETKEELDGVIDKLRNRVMKIRVRFSDQELEELKEEMYRTQLLIDFKMLKMQLNNRGKTLELIETAVLDRVERALDSEKKIERKHREEYMSRIKRIRRRQNLEVYYQTVTREEKDLIVKAMGMAQGHWFKCPNGHIYCITECGGAMEEGKCPECGSRIGGLNHQLRSDNQLARDMDGARYAAFSDMANIQNFDPRDFM